MAIKTSEIPQDVDNIMSLVGYRATTIFFSRRALGGAWYDEIHSSLADTITLEQQIKNAIAREQEIFNKLSKYGIENVDELNARLAKYEQAVFPLSGPQLANIFFGIKKRVQGYDLQDLAQLQSLLSQKTIEMIKDENNIINEEAMLNEVIKLMRKLENNGKAARRIKEINFQNNSSKEGYIKVSEFTKAQRKAIEKAIDVFNSDKKNKEKQIKKKTFEVENSFSDDQVRSDFSWQGVIDFKTKAQAEELVKQGLLDLNEINSTIRNEIIKTCGNDPIIVAIIDHILKQDRYAFFVGFNEKDITGLLGEIKAMYYLATFFGIENIQWLGGLQIGEGNQKPHRDILLDETVGVQVKNTTRDISSHFSSYFTNASLDTALSSFPPNVSMIFKSFYGTLAFNVPYYVTKGGKAMAGTLHNKNPNMKTFLRRREQVLALIPQMEKVMSIYASNLMFLETAETLEKQNLTDTNSLFFIGGKTFVLVSQMLQDILDYIKGETESRPIHISYSINNNIVDEYNSSTSKWLTMDEVSDRVKLTSSYTFKLPK